MGISKKLMEKSIKDGKLWNNGLLQYHVIPISSMIPSPLEALTDRRPRTLLPQIPSSIGKTVESSRFCQELIKRQLSTSTSYSMCLKPGQHVFIKEVYRNVWKTGTIDQPAKELKSYWVRFPDDSILRRTCQMIKPRTQPSHFKLETQSHERNTEEYRTSSRTPSFQTMFLDPGQQAFLTGKLAAPAVHEPMTSVERQDIATSSPDSSGATTPSIPAVRWLTHSTKDVLPRRFSPLRE